MLSSVPRKRFTSADFRIVAFILPNCELKLWQSSELLRCILNVANHCDGRRGGHQPPLSQSISETLQTAASSKKLSINSATVVPPLATSLLSVEMRSTSPRRKGRRSNPLGDTMHHRALQRQVWHPPRRILCVLPFASSRDNTSSFVTWRRLATLPTFKHYVPVRLRNPHSAPGMKQEHC